jgi:hypothetical protein
MDTFAFEALSVEYEDGVRQLRSICGLAEWEHHKAWLAPTDILLTRHTVDELKKEIQLNILWIAINNVKNIAFLELVTGCGRHKNDFPERISEYSNIAALYYLWSEIHKKTQPEDAYKALFGAVRVLMKLIGVLEAIEIAHIQEKQEKKKMTARVKGGKAQNERYDSVKQEIVRQLKSKTVGEYATKQAAAEAILEAVWLFSESLTAEINAENQKLPTFQQTRKAPGLVKDNLIRQMLDWSRKDDRVSDAFNSVVQPRKGRSSVSLPDEIGN